MNTENSKTSEPHKFRLTSADKINLKDPNKNMAIANLSIYYTWKNIKPAYNNNQFKISAPTWNNEFDLPDGSYSVPDIQDNFKHIIENNETIGDNPPVQIYVNKIKNRIIFKTKTGYKLELLSPETMKLLRRTNLLLIKIKMKKMCQNQNLLYLFQYIVIQSIAIINKHLKYYLLLCQIFSQLITIAPHSLTMLNNKYRNFHPLKYDLLIKIASNLQQKIMLI